jgi:uncharacterized cupredoxin-like copper-binding protein
LVLLAALAAVGLVLVSCGSSTSAGLTPPSSAGGAGSTPVNGTPVVGNTTLTMSEKEFSITPAIAKAHSGKIDFFVNNDGTIIHNFAVNVDGKEVKSADVKPGQKIQFTVTIDKAGDYTYYCAIPGHEQAGMKGTLTVTTSDVPSNTANP